MNVESKENGGEGDDNGNGNGNGSGLQANGCGTLAGAPLQGASGENG
jgi:hypothetical protein